MPHAARLLSVISLALLVPAAGAQTTLNKCIDADGLVTYTNKPCVNAREVRKLEIDPSPVPPIAPLRIEPATSAETTVNRSGAPSQPASVQLETRKTPTQPAQLKASAGACETLSEQLGRILDKMDQARRKGYTQAQMDKWNEEARALERKKQQSACF